MKRVRKRVQELTDARQSGKDVKQIIAKLNPAEGNGVGRFEKWSHDRFVAMGLYCLQGTVKYPAQATQRRSSCKSCAGKLHARFERGLLKTGWLYSQYRVKIYLCSERHSFSLA
jgi:hypothetical protein